MYVVFLRPATREASYCSRQEGGNPGSKAPALESTCTVSSVGSPVFWISVQPFRVTKLIPPRDARREKSASSVQRCFWFISQGLFQNFAPGGKCLISKFKRGHLQSHIYIPPHQPIPRGGKSPPSPPPEINPVSCHQQSVPSISLSCVMEYIYI